MDLIAAFEKAGGTYKAMFAGPYKVELIVFPDGEVALLLNGERWWR